MLTDDERRLRHEIRQVMYRIGDKHPGVFYSLHRTRLGENWISLIFPAEPRAHYEEHRNLELADALQMMKTDETNWDFYEIFAANNIEPEVES